MAPPWPGLDWTEGIPEEAYNTCCSIWIMLFPFILGELGYMFGKSRFYTSIPAVVDSYIGNDMVREDKREEAIDAYKTWTRYPWPFDQWYIRRKEKGFLTEDYLGKIQRRKAKVPSIRKQIRKHQKERKKED